MSTGAECRIIEKNHGQWWYELQQYPYGATEEYNTSGPFPTFKAAYDHLHRHNANPGGYWCEALPGCPHDLKHPVEHPLNGDKGFFCDRCGSQVEA